MTQVAQVAQVVVTGLGVVAPTGRDTAEFWRSALAGVSGIRAISRFDTSRYPVRYAGEVGEFDPAEAIAPRVVAQTDLWTQFALDATRQALGWATLDPGLLDGFDIGVTTSAGSGGNAFGQREIEALWARGPRHVGPYQSIAWFYAASTGQISIGHGMRGPCAVVSSESAGGLDAVAHARGAIRRGCRVQVCGGAEAPLSPYALTCHWRSGLLSTRGGEPDCYRPFTRDASGHVPGEGGAVAVLEDAAHARRRGVRALATVSGHAATFTGPQWAVDERGRRERETEALSAAIRLALTDARVWPEEIGAVFADGLGQRDADRAEIAALRAVFGRSLDRVPVTVSKPALGRAYSAAGCFDLAAAALSLRDGVVPPAAGLAQCDIAVNADVVTGRARPVELRHVLLLARGFGGFSSALVLSSTTQHDSSRRRE
ncbi:ketosynthase chain-length factor [Saccharomonospora piscinae]|uniref:beta-ketoacyl synthase N-terminal-like domain-containing protein n=1 Tax=Saccharomonospora piscinae TaxID=687388 RepID=UPI0011061F83|nr:beta-ketoacyl synthase N-terminal-like domain-containing protein [Saccharomonospora piscinae]TLW94482.1 ketosynthase chain-length factor [Saccharomonospora piscinae]